MSTNISADFIQRTMLQVLDETFAHVSGIYLDSGTSLTETLSKLSAIEASRPIVENGTTIASQTDHLHFYISLLIDLMDGKSRDKVDWNSTWLIRTVNEKQWESLRNSISEDYRQLQSRWKDIANWEIEKRLGDAIAVIVHTAYHLGAIRQIVHIAKGN